MTEQQEAERLRALEARLAELKARQDPPPAKESHHSLAHAAWRMVIELVSGLGIGAAIGYGLDVLLDTRPFLLVVFTLLGFAAGISTMLRTARELQDKTDKAGKASAARKEGGTGG